MVQTIARWSLRLLGFVNLLGALELLGIRGVVYLLLAIILLSAGSWEGFRRGFKRGMRRQHLVHAIEAVRRRRRVGEGQ